MRALSRRVACRIVSLWASIAAGRVTILFLALESSPDIARTVLRRHVPLLRALRLWTWRVVLPRAFEGAYDAFQTMVDDELEKPLDARVQVEHLREAFARRRADREARTTSPIGDDWRGFRERSFHA